MGNTFLELRPRRRIDPPTARRRPGGPRGPFLLSPKVGVCQWYAGLQPVGALGSNPVYPSRKALHQISAP